MSEFFLELFSEEIPVGLQKNLREKIFNDFQNLFDERSIRSKKSLNFSSPNRVVIVFQGLDRQTQIKPKEIRRFKCLYAVGLVVSIHAAISSAVQALSGLWKKHSSNIL